MITAFGWIDSRGSPKFAATDDECRLERTARAVTGKKAIVKVEGGSHGGYDPLQVSVQ